MDFVIFLFLSYFRAGARRVFCTLYQQEHRGVKSCKLWRSSVQTTLISPSARALLLSSCCLESPRQTKPKKGPNKKFMNFAHFLVNSGVFPQENKHESTPPFCRALFWNFKMPQYCEECHDQLWLFHDGGPLHKTKRYQPLLA